MQVHIDPPIVRSLYNKDPESTEVVSLDLRAESATDDRIRFELNLIFERLSIGERGMLFPERLYIGSSGGRASISFLAASLRDFTPPATIEYRHTTRSHRTNSTHVAILPEITNKGGGLEASVKGVGLTTGEEGVVEETAELTTSQHNLAAVAFPDGVRWEFLPPPVAHQIRHFVYGNVRLFAEFNSTPADLVGKITYGPTGVAVYRDDGQPIGARFSISLLFLLWKRKGYRFQKFLREREIQLRVVRDV